MSQQEKNAAKQEEQKIKNSQDSQESKSSKKVKKPKKAKQPKGWIRWSGVITLLVIVGLVAGLVYFIAAFALKNKVEDLASEAWGAKVEVRSLGFGISPLGLKLDGLAITDTENPMENLVEIDRIRMTINLYHLVHKRLVFEDVALNGLSLHQPRKTSGFIAKKPQVEKPQDSAKDSVLELASSALPTTDELLERESLETLELAEKLDKDIKSTQQKWEEIKQNLPSEETLASYQQELEDIFKGDISSLDDLKAQQAKFKKLEQKWKQDKAALKEAKKFLSESSKGLTRDIGLLKDMPNQDLERLLNAYSLDADGLENISHLLFGAEIQEKIQLARSWYNKAQPLIEWIKEYQKEQQAKKELEKKLLANKPERFKGEWIKFPENDPQPKFMIKRISFDGELDGTIFQTKVWDLNFNHKESQKAVRLALMYHPQTQANALVAEATISSIETDDAITNAQISWQDYSIADWEMLKISGMDIQLDRAKAQVSSDLVLTNLERIDAKMLIDYQDVAFNLAGDSEGQVKRLLEPTLKSINRFEVDFDLTGKLLAPRVGVGSDLDRKLSQGFKQALSKELDAFKKDLEKELQAKLQTALKPLESDLNKLGLDLNQLSSTESLLEGLDKQGSDRLKQEQKKIEQEAKNKAKAAAKKETEKLKKEAGDKLKKLLPF